MKPQAFRTNRNADRHRKGSVQVKFYEDGAVQAEFAAGCRADGHTQSAVLRALIRGYLAERSETRGNV